MKHEVQSGGGVENEIPHSSRSSRIKSTGHLKEMEALEYLNEVSELVVHPMEDEELASEALSVAIKYEHPVYDAMYAVLARRLSCPLMTRDRRLRDLLERLRIDSV